MRKFDPTKSYSIFRKGQMTFKFIYSRGKLQFQTDLEPDENGDMCVSMPLLEDVEEIEKMLREKVGDGVDSRGHILDPTRQGGEGRVPGGLADSLSPNPLSHEKRSRRAAIALRGCSPTSEGQSSGP